MIKPLPAAHRQPSLKRRLLVFLLLPTLLLLIIDWGFVYVVALRYSNYVHDRDLVQSLLGMSRVITSGDSDGRLPPVAARLIDYDPEGMTFFAIRSLRRGLLSGSSTPVPPRATSTLSATPELYDATIAASPARVAAMVIAMPGMSGDRISLSVAETLHDRDARAREILMITVPVELILILALLALVWQGVRVGLRSLDPPIKRLAERERDLAPVSGPDIPVEILPLTLTIDGLFARVRDLVALQERFVADAAHQLRTPLAGLSMHLERALACPPDGDARASLLLLQSLTARVVRTSTQLLALARLQAPMDVVGQRRQLALDRWLPDVVSQRIPQSLQAGVDLGYDGADTGQAWILADPSACQELVDNLIDNALAHVSARGTVTVSLETADDRRARIVVEDDGAGVDEGDFARLGERFFRAANAVQGGSGLGLAIVRRIAAAHDASVAFGRARLGGLRVEIAFPRTAGPIA